MLILYGTRDCTLCDEARARVMPLAAAFGWSIEEVDVADDDALFGRYGERIPVLRRRDLARELDWPFDAAELHALVAAPRGEGD